MDSRLPALSVLTLASLAATAQEASTGGRGLVIVPSVSLTQTVTNNVSPGFGEKQSDAITQITPGIRISSYSGRVQGSVDYALSGLLHARGGHDNEVQQTLSARLKVEAIEKFAYLDSQASISQQNISSVGLRVPDTTLDNRNRTEVSTVYLSPYVKGELGGLLGYEARLNHALTRSSQSETGDSTTSGGTLRLGPAATGARLAWGFEASHQVVDFRAGRETESQRYIASLSYRLTPDVLFTLRGGREANTLLTQDSESYNTSGWGLTWTPSERTLLSIDRDQRFFGSSYAVRFEHRMPRSVWRLSMSKGITGDQNTGGGAPNTATVYDLLFQQFASIAPDPVQREALVNAYLRDNGLDRSALAANGFLASSASQDRRSELSLALLGLRSSLIMTLYESTTRRLDPLVQVVDELSNGNQLRQQGVSINATHRLTPASALNLGLVYQQSRSSLGNEQSKLRSVSLTWSGTISPRSTLSIGGRSALFNNTAQSYSETAAFATLSLTF